MDLTDAIKHIQDTSAAKTRQPFVTVPDGRVFQYSDHDQFYDEIDRFVRFEGSVSTVESFAELVVEYARRFEQKKFATGEAGLKPTGTNQTVTFTSAGATYSPDDEDRRHLFTYHRVLSQQWNALVAALGKPLSHKGLIRTLQTLSPSIVNYPQVFAAFQRLAISKDVRLTSEPVLGLNGASDNSYHVSLSIKGSNVGETTLPSQIEAEVNYARGGSAAYIVPIEVDLAEDEKDEGVPVITLFAPTLAAIADQAVMDEMKLFEESMTASGLTELLTVVNF
jgi:hypothetical protein